MKELINYNQDLLMIAAVRLQRLMDADYNKNHPGPYFDAVNKQLDYVNILKERIKILYEKNNNSR